MKHTRITVLWTALHEDLFEQHRDNSCDPKGKVCPYFSEGQSFEVSTMSMPEGFCPVAWGMVFDDLTRIALGGSSPWLEAEGQAISCCRDGLRPVTFLIERAKEEA
jgi:uncharacterized repeat protein (TIGR04076 family)